ncbi:MAG: hypothetical protein HQL93_02800, partial [Magnetococcales bacterium]|nr:hypothetical protein [Magnetococcales bacterium]
MFGQEIKKSAFGLLFAVFTLLWSCGLVHAESVSGSIGPGAIVIAVDATDKVLQFTETTGGTTSARTFSLSGLPVDQDIRLYFFIDGQLRPMIFDNGTKDAFQLKTGAAFNFGFVSLRTTDEFLNPTNRPNTGLVVESTAARHTDISMREVQDTLVGSLTAPDVTALIGYGKAAFRHGWIVAAYKFFSKADSLVTDAEVKNKTHIFHALSRVAAMGMNTTKSVSSTTTTYSTMGDLLAGFGCTKRHLGFDGMICPDLLPIASPTGTDIGNWLNASMIPEVTAALELLNAIPATMLPILEQEDQWSLGASSGVKTEIDYSDVLVFKGALEFILGQLYINHAYDWTIDIDAALDLSTQDALKNYANAGTLSAVSSTNLASGKSHLTSAADYLLAAVASIQTETDVQDDDLISLNSTEVTDLKDLLTKFKSSLSGSTVYTSGTKTLTLNLSKFFDGISLRAVVPPITGNKASGVFPDVTMGGIFPDKVYNFRQESVNLDVNNNGIPDILEGNGTQGLPPGTTPLLLSSGTIMNLTVGGTAGSLKVSGGVPTYQFISTPSTTITLAAGSSDAEKLVSCQSVGIGSIQVSDKAIPLAHMVYVTVNCASGTTTGGGDLVVTPGSIMNLTVGGTPAPLKVSGGTGGYQFSSTSSTTITFVAGTSDAEKLVSCQAAGTGTIQIVDAATPNPHSVSVTVNCTSGTATGGGDLVVMPGSIMNLTVGGTPAPLKVSGGTGGY